MLYMNINLLRKYICQICINMKWLYIFTAFLNYFRNQGDILFLNCLLIFMRDFFSDKAEWQFKWCWILELSWREISEHNLHLIYILDTLAKKPFSIAVVTFPLIAIGWKRNVYRYIKLTIMFFNTISCEIQIVDDTFGKY